MTIIILHTGIYKKKQKQHKKHILESAANIKFTCELYVVANYILLNWKIIYRSELLMNEQLMVSLHLLVSLPRTMLCRSFEVSVSVTKTYYLFSKSCGQQHSDHVN